jgi:hypothetical protein
MYFYLFEEEFTLICTSEENDSGYCEVTNFHMIKNNNKSTFGLYSVINMFLFQEQDHAKEKETSHITCKTTAGFVPHLTGFKNIYCHGTYSISFEISLF